MMGPGFLMMLGGLIVPFLLVAWLVFRIAQPNSAGRGPQLPVFRPPANTSSAARICTHCGASLQAEWVHCPQCGAPA